MHIKFQPSVRREKPNLVTGRFTPAQRGDAWKVGPASRHVRTLDMVNERKFRFAALAPVGGKKNPLERGSAGVFFTASDLATLQITLLRNHTFNKIVLLRCCFHT
jgi:hypothetical protein